ncbi:transmembrane protein 218 [Sorex araneus]|uniref:transmembrane protein 218 n=1 Tax=Sorex araneus TaxID=42254 RepID=UPI0003315A8B|nr:transmembrane protein 218 [Sorex araneus]XP_054990004.1 transmembrane protein 218 [Sorex araneus]
MTSTVLGVGNGVFIMAMMWVSALVLFMLLSRSTGVARFAGYVILIGSLVVTLIMVLLPRDDELPEVEEEAQIVDALFICRYILLALLMSIFLGSVFLLLVQHVLEPVYSKSLRSH